jgi:hypothetical protein
MRVFAVAAAALVMTTGASSGNPPDPVNTATVETGAAPCGVAARAGSIWVGVYRAGMLLELHDRSGRRETAVDVGRWACRVAVGPAAVWVTRDQAGELVRISRGSGRVKRMLVGTGAFDVLLASGSVWTTSYDTAVVAQIDPARMRVTRAYKDGVHPSGLTRCDGRIWVGHGGDATWLTRIDPTSHAIRRIQVGTTNPSWPRCIRGVLWVTASGTLLKVNGTTGRVLARLQLGGTLVEAVEGPDALIWVTDKERSLVHRIGGGEPSLADTFAAGPGAYASARAGNAMWITSFAGSDIRRYER